MDRFHFNASQDALDMLDCDEKHVSTSECGNFFIIYIIKLTQICIITGTAKTG